ncbi:MAG TPA: nickel-binding protein [Acidimicrobiia bacterium]|nr:nickel-binding protein [Acidimicrobiia bacterium]
MYLDRHDSPGVSAEELALAHQLDSEVQERYGVRYHTYWFDPDRGTVFCLAEGPSEQAIVDVHAEAHGQLASAVIELDPTAPLNAMLGPLPTHPVGTAYSEPALRAIVFTDIRGSVAQTIELGDEGHMIVLRAHDDIVRRTLEQHAGREVKHTGDGIMAAFASVSAAVEFAIDAQRAFADWNVDSETPIHVGIGISAGEPVTGDNDDLFGAAVQLAARLCGAADSGDIAVSVAVRELCVGKRFGFDDRGALPLKGIPEPVQVFAVAWRE